MPPFTFGLAIPADDAALRRLLRENPIPGTITLTFEREPSYFGAAVVEGPFQQTIVARDGATGMIVGMGSRAVRPLTVNGQVMPVGYMSQLRIDGRYGWGAAVGRVVRQGFAFYRQLHADGRTPFYLLSLVADNHAAERLLRAGLPHGPYFRPYATLHTYAIATRRKRPPLPLPGNLHLVTGADCWLPAIVACLQRCALRQQFAPWWAEETLFHAAHTPGLRPEDFVLAVQGDEVVGCLACWDQSQFKQTVVRGYQGLLGQARPLWNVITPLTGWPTLPPPNTALKHGYVSHLAVANDHPMVFAALLRHAHSVAVERRYQFLMLGLAAADTKNRLMRAYQTLCYPSQITIAAWDEDLEAVAGLDDRPLGVEIALL
jgi:hypothetical protein